MKGNRTTGAQRYNKRLHKIFDDAKILKAKVRNENLEYLKTIGYNSPGIDTYSDEIIGKLAYNHKREDRLNHYKNILRNIDKYPKYSKKNVETIIAELENNQ